METTIFLVRHGETVDNARQIMQGQTQGELNQRGREQAEQVARRLASEPLDAIVASDLHRAIQTAEVIAEPHGLPVVTTPLLRIESEEALLERARSFLINMTATYPGKRVVAVGHGIINKAVLAVYAQCTMREVQRMMNAEVRILTMSSERAASAAAVTSAERTATAASAE